MKIVIDGHRHIGNCEGRGSPTLETIISDMEKKHIDISIACPSGASDDEGRMSREEAAKKEKAFMEAADIYFRTRQETPFVKEARNLRVDHTKVKDAIRRSEGKIKGCWFLNPWGGSEEFDKAAEAIGSGDFVYLKLHPQHHLFYPEDASVGHVYGFAAELDVPVWFHSSYGPGSEIARISEAAKRFGDVAMVLGHGCVEPGPTLIDDLCNAFKNDNIYLDLSHASKDVFITVLEKFPHDRLIAGTDDPYIAYDTIFDHYLKCPGDFPCGEGSWEAILGGNAQRIYRLAV